MLLQIGEGRLFFFVSQEQPLVDPQEMHFRQVPLRTMVN